jgi:peptidoglycan/xylan/chitin deacetylase (PgdA/CDA1 family)
MLLVLVLSVYSLVLNQCDSSTPCVDGSCSSQYGWCGKTIDYCSVGCQSNCNIINNVNNTIVNECGGTKLCSNGACCSQYGWCGLTVDYCENGCQSNCKSTVINTPPIYPITKNNNCGPETLTRCPLTGNVCCSDNGICGKSVKECGLVRWACRPEFGKCNGPAPSSNIVPLINLNNKANLIVDCILPGMFALTYDDGIFDYTNTLLNILKINNVKATFFINAYNWGDITVEPYKSYLKNVYNSKHQIASHTYDHLDMTKLNDKELWNQMYRNDIAIKSVIGVSPVYMRPPYGLLNDHVMSALESWGYKVIWKNIDSEDVLHINNVQLNTNSYLNSLNNKSSKTDSFISLQHETLIETVDSWTQTAINLVKSLNYTFVTVGECRGDKIWYR